jgi:hypothetical protein
MKTLAAQKTSTTWRNAAIVATLLVTSVAGLAAANATTLSWRTTSLHTPYLSDCLSFARGAMQALGYQNIRVKSNEVSAEHAGAIIAVTCVGTKPPTAIVMGAGNDDNATSTSVRELAQRLAGVARLD